jgi:hypothetical protein
MARYRAEVMMDRTPQTPFMMVIKSANRKFLTVSRGREGMKVCSKFEDILEIDCPAVHLSRIDMKRPKKGISTYRTSEKCPSSFLYCCNNFFFS